jgi:hypothetical protein
MFNDQIMLTGPPTPPSMLKQLLISGSIFISPLSASAARPVIELCECFLEAGDFSMLSIRLDGLSLRRVKLLIRLKLLRNSVPFRMNFDAADRCTFNNKCAHLINACGYFFFDVLYYAFSLFWLFSVFYIVILNAPFQVLKKKIKISLKKSLKKFEKKFEKKFAIQHPANSSASLYFCMVQPFVSVTHPITAQCFLTSVIEGTGAFNIAYGRGPLA